MISEQNRRIVIATLISFTLSLAVSAWADGFPGGVRDALITLFPSQAASFNELLAADLGQIPDGRAKADGIDLGRQAAAEILALRANDGSQRAEPRIGIDFIISDEPGKWRQDPISLIPL